jgi:threonine aldolase
MIILENTHNKAGGVALESAYFSAVRGVIGSRWIHLDGSRLFNAAVALDVSPAQLSGAVDSVSLSLNKGLCAPVGALLAGPKAFIEEATRLRQQIGGGWRPVGMLAAAALLALRTQIERLAEDHRHARLLAETLAESPLIRIDLNTVQTNIVRAQLDVARLPAERLSGFLECRGVRIQVSPAGAMRMVTYRDITGAMIDEVRCLLRTALGPGSELIQQ